MQYGTGQNSHRGLTAALGIDGVGGGALLDVDGYSINSTVVTCEREFQHTALHGVARCDDLAIPLYGHGQSAAVNTAEIRGRFSVAIEGRIQAAIAVVARKRESIHTIFFDKACRDDFAVSLQRHGIPNVCTLAESRGRLAIAVESGIQAAVGVVAGEREF